jgi:hypothetical protein
MQFDYAKALPVSKIENSGKNKYQTIEVFPNESASWQALCGGAKEGKPDRQGGPAFLEMASRGE